MIFLDWSVRESFQILNYLAQQTVARDRFEVIVVEYYSRISQAICKYEDQVDTWVLLEMPADTYYHKHLMYNAGIVLSRGKIVVIGDSDAMVRESFLESILRAFQQRQEIVLHLDQFRNNRRDFYPFNFPSFAEVIGDGCINWRDGKTVGLWDTEDILHTRNYGACFAAFREDVISIGGADEHVDYLGHICGPYEMTFRLVNFGKNEVWHPSEFLYHVWHPGQAGDKNYLGPHDGRQVSTRALQARRSGRVFPFVENPAIRLMRLKSEGSSLTSTSLLSRLVRVETLRTWSVAEIAKRKVSLTAKLLSLGSLLVSLRLFKTLVKMVARQFWIKLTKVPRQLTSPRIILRKIINVYFFLRNACHHNLYVLQQARQVFDELAQQGIRNVSVYGTGEIAEMLYGLTAETSVKIESVYDDFGNKKFLGYDVLPIEAGAKNEEKIIIAAVVGVEEKIARLMTLGIERERIAVLQ